MSTTPSDPPTPDLDAYEDRFAHPALASLPSLVERLVAKAQQARERRIREWGGAIGSAPVTMCQRHPGQALSADVERSAHASDRARRVVIVCHPCPECEADAVRQRQERQLLRRGIPARSLHITLETWEAAWEPTAAEARGKAWLAVQQWTQGHPPASFLVILGMACGTGKTALGVAALRAFGRDIRCLDQRDWIESLLALDPSERGPALDSVRQYPALMIDDVGNRTVGARDQEGGNAMERDALAAVLNWRFERRLPSILTSNLPPKDFIRRFDPRTIDRIRAGRVLIDASGWPSRRAAEEGL